MSDAHPSPDARTTRMDAHCHSRASDGPALAALSFIECPECYSPPERVYEQARARGMDLVTITDHDTVRGAWELVERGFERFVAGEEVTVYFPEDRCKLHVLVWAMTPALDDELRREGLRDDVYQFAAWLRERELPHAFAHPLYMQNGRLTRWHLERAALLFKGFEVLNGAHQARHRAALERFLDALNPVRIGELAERHGLAPLWDQPWIKARTGGSDDHGLLNTGRTYTQIAGRIDDPREFLRRAMAGESTAGGVGGHSSLLAHQLTTVGAHYYAETLADRAGPSGQLVASKLLRFAGVDLPRPSKLHVAAEAAWRRLFFRKRKTLPLVRALRHHVAPVLQRYPDLRDRLSTDRFIDGTAMAQHESMARFADELVRALHGALSDSAVRAFRKRDKLAIVDHLLSYGVLSAAQLPYIFSLFYQNKERIFLEEFEHETSAPGDGVSVLERPMRISLFTDTLGDVNGVSRFITNVAEQALATGRDLQVITSTRMSVPPLPNMYNFTPAFAMKMPRYENLEAVLPPLVPMLRHLDEHQPDCIHISTPGPVGMVGFVAAKMLRVPVLGVYHTDFPAYIDHLFEDHAFTTMCSAFMRFFYAPFRAIFTRSEDYVESLERLGLRRERTVSLMPGFDTEMFHARHADRAAWAEYPGVDPSAVKVLYVGRVSVEKNLPLLTGVWKEVARRVARAGAKAELILVGDGPYRETMQRELKGTGAHFLGFKHGQELSRIYASSDLFVFPSVTDTLGQVVMESQGSGLPVLVTDRGGPKEVVREGRTGFVLSPDQPDLWAERIFDLIADESKRRAMGAEAHRFMQTYSIRNSFEHFWDVHVQAWHEHLAARGIEPKGPQQVHRTRPRPDREADPVGAGLPESR